MKNQVHIVYRVVITAKKGHLLRGGVRWVQAHFDTMVDAQGYQAAMLEDQQATAHIETYSVRTREGNA